MLWRAASTFGCDLSRLNLSSRTTSTLSSDIYTIPRARTPVVWSQVGQASQRYIVDTWQQQFLAYILVRDSEQDLRWRMQVRKPTHAAGEDMDCETRTNAQAARVSGTWQWHTEASTFRPSAPWNLAYPRAAIFERGTIGRTRQLESSRDVHRRAEIHVG